MKTALILASIVTLSVLTACGAPQYSNTGDSQIRKATPGVVDHNVIPKRSKR